MQLNAETLRETRKKHGLTQAQAAKILHVAERTLSDWERKIAAAPEGLVELFLIKTGEIKTSEISANVD